MWLLIFALFGLLIGSDLRLRGLELCRTAGLGMEAELHGRNAVAMGAWISLLAAVCLDVAVWRLF